MTKNESLRLAFRQAKSKFITVVLVFPLRKGKFRDSSDTQDYRALGNQCGGAVPAPTPLGMKGPLLCS